MGLLRIDETRYAVRYGDQLAINAESQVKLFFKAKPAREFAKELEKHLKEKCKVVRVAVSFREIKHAIGRAGE